MKKCLAIILALVMALGCMSVAAFAEEVDCEYCGGTGKETGDVAFLTYVRQKMDEIKNIDAASFDAAFGADKDSAVQSRINMLLDCSRDIPMKFDIDYMIWYPVDTFRDEYTLVDNRVKELATEFDMSATQLEIYRDSYRDSDDFISEWEHEFSDIEGAYNALAEVVGNLPCRVCLGTGKVEAPEEPEEPENDFLTTFTLNKDYNDKYTADAKSTKVNETVSFTITPVDANAPEFADNGVFTMTVDDGIGSAEVDLPDTDDITSVGDYWYEIEETAGTTAGVTYDDTTYYLHLIVSYKDGEFGFSSAAIHTTENGEGENDAKITLVSNSYGEGTLTIAQDTTVNGEDSSEDTFTAEVTFTAPAGTVVTGEITYGDKTIKPEDWENGSVTVEVELKGGETVTFENIPDGVTYTVEQTEGNEDKGYELDDVVFDNEDEDGDSVTSNIASGTIGDSADTVTISNTKTVPVDVGVIVEYTSFILLVVGALAMGAWLVISRRRKAIDAE